MGRGTLESILWNWLFLGGWVWDSLKKPVISKPTYLAWYLRAPKLAATKRKTESIINYRRLIVCELSASTLYRCQHSLVSKYCSFCPLLTYHCLHAPIFIEWLLYARHCYRPSWCRRRLSRQSHWSRGVYILVWQVVMLLWPCLGVA